MKAILSIIVLIILLSSTASKAATKDMFENKAYGYSIYCPADWVINDKAYFTGFKRKTAVGAYENAVFITPGSVVEAVITETTENEKQHNNVLESVTPTKLSGEDAVKAVYTDKSDKTNITNYYFVKKNGLIYALRLRFSSKPLTEVSDKMLRSFKFYEKEYLFSF